jgi:hypothetical protein
MVVFKSPDGKTKPEWSLAFVALHDTYADFVLSRQARNLVPTTLTFYYCTCRLYGIAV